MHASRHTVRLASEPIVAAEAVLVDGSDVRGFAVGLHGGLATAGVAAFAVVGAGGRGPVRFAGDHVCGGGRVRGSDRVGVFAAAGFEARADRHDVLGAGSVATFFSNIDLVLLTNNF